MKGQSGKQLVSTIHNLNERNEYFVFFSFFFSTIITTPNCTHIEYDHNNNEMETFRNRKMRPFRRNANSLLPNVRSKCRQSKSLFSHFPFSFQSALPAHRVRLCACGTTCATFPPIAIATHCVYIFAGEAVIAWERIERNAGRKSILGACTNTHTHVYSLFRGLWFRCSDASVLHSRRSFLTKTFSRRKNRMERCDSWCIFSNDDIITGRTQRPNGNGIDWRYFYAHARQEWHWYASSSTWLPFSFRICENNSKKASFWRNWRNEARRNDDSKAIVSCVCAHNIWH